MQCTSNHHLTDHRNKRTVKNNSTQTNKGKRHSLTNNPNEHGYMKMLCTSTAWIKKKRWIVDHNTQKYRTNVYNTWSLSTHEQTYKHENENFKKDLYARPPKSNLPPYKPYTWTFQDNCSNHLLETQHTTSITSYNTCSFSTHSPNVQTYCAQNILQHMFPLYHTTNVQTYKLA